MASRIILVTGSNQGIGFEVVRQLAQKGHTVYLAARSVEKGKEALAKLHAEGLKTVKFVPLDVTDQASVDNAAKQIASEQPHLDVLVNNAGILVDEPKPTETSVELIKHVFETNFFGVIRVTTAFLPLLRKSSNPVISNISSGLGSSTQQSTPGHAFSSFQKSGYNSSKAALNHYTITIAHDFKEARVNVISPGYVATGMNNYAGIVAVDKSAAGVIKNSILLDQTGPTGKFLDWEEKTWPW